MSQAPGGAPGGGQPHHPGVWATWIAFAGMMMILIGIFDVIAGLAAVTKDGYFVGGDEGIFVFNLTVVGIIWIIVGILIAWAGWALIQGAEWARAVTIVLTFVNAVTNLLMLTAQPILSLILIALNVTVLYAVTIRWHDARVGLEE